MAAPCSPVPARFALCPGRLKGRQVQAQELMLPTAECPVAHLEAASGSSGARAGALGL